MTHHGADLNYFLAVATIIPILFIAMLFDASTFGLVASAQRAVVVMFIWIGVAAGAEAKALSVLANGHGSLADAKSLGTPLVLLAWGVILPPFWRQVLRWDEERKMNNEADIRATCWVLYLFGLALGIGAVILA